MKEKYDELIYSNKENLTQDGLLKIKEEYKNNNIKLSINMFKETLQIPIDRFNIENESKIYKSICSIQYLLYKVFGLIGELINKIRGNDYYD